MQLTVNQYYVVTDTLSYMYCEAVSFAEHNGKINDNFMKDTLQYFIWHSLQRNLIIIFLFFKINKKDFESAFHHLYSENNSQEGAKLNQYVNISWFWGQMSAGWPSQ